MPNTKPFQPLQPEKKVTVEITKREWNMVQIMRSISFGKIEVQKLNNIIIRIEPRTSIIIDEEMVI
jgi:hypothetical protein